MEGEAKMCTACNMAANEEGKCPGCGADVHGGAEAPAEGAPAAPATDSGDAPAEGGNEGGEGAAASCNTAG